MYYTVIKQLFTCSRVLAATDAGM